MYVVGRAPAHTSPVFFGDVSPYLLIHYQIELPVRHLDREASRPTKNVGGLEEPSGPPSGGWIYCGNINDHRDQRKIGGVGHFWFFMVNIVK